MRINLYSGIIGAIVVASLLFGGCSETAVPEPEPEPTTPPANQVTEEESGQIALEFLTNSPTYLYDGIEDTVKLADTITLRCPSCWSFVYVFESRHAGYGDRKGQGLVQVITPHRAAITVQEGNVTRAVMDDVWDMMFQAIMATEEASRQTALDFLI